MNDHHIECAAIAAHRAESGGGKWNELDESKKSIYRTIAAKAVNAYLEAAEQNSGPSSLQTTSKDQIKQIQDWIDSHTASYIRRKLGISLPQAEGIKSKSKETIEQFLHLLNYAINNEPSIVSEEIKKIEEASGMNRAQTALMLGVTNDLYRKAAAGKPVDAITARYIKYRAGK